MTCLQGQDEQREGLLKSIHDQLEKFVTNEKDVSIDLCYFLLFMSSYDLQMVSLSMSHYFLKIWQNCSFMMPLIKTQLRDYDLYL